MNEQQRLLDAIWSHGSPDRVYSSFNEQGIDIYRRNLLSNAYRALSISFPTIFQLVDGDIGTDLVKQFLTESTPNQGDWTQWGEGFSDHLKASSISNEYPYLPDCAALDWRVHRALHGKDQILDQPSLQRLDDSDPENIVVTLNSNVALLTTQYPIVDIFHAHHHHNETQRALALNQAKKALSHSLVTRELMVYRPEFQPLVAQLTPIDGEFTHHLLSGKPLAQALEAVHHDSDFSFPQWLVKAVERNLIYRLDEKKV